MQERAQTSFCLIARQVLHYLQACASTVRRYGKIRTVRTVFS